ncbi:MAG: sigma-70 family RNA polymerase sigma factor, partial [Oscillospiraceae bacterium]|nr:sigma-70 family RNA polymerase sigma factor [Oscillospiraceae bacterium]
MNHTQAEQTIMRLMKPIYGFARNRCASLQDAEDVTQEICMKLYRALIVRNDITDPDKFAWTIAHNVLANYYRGRSRHGINVPIHDFEEILPDDGDFTAQIEDAETLERLHREIAYLSKTRRRIVIMHYFEGKRQQEIADALDLPLGTVKWYLSEAKNELKKGMETMRTNSELKFNPIEFSMIGTNGSAGYMGQNGVYVRSALAQNILYLTRNESMTVNEIADTLGVSPVFVESETEFLEENCFMLKRGKESYIANVIINIPTTESNRLQSEMYEKAADIFAPEIFDALAANVKADDLNFALWALVPYITARSGTPDDKVTFEEAATVRPDGGMNICYCSIMTPDAEPKKYSESMKKMGGPSWNGDDNFLLWLIDTEWGGCRVGNYHPDLMNRDTVSLKAFIAGTISEDEKIRMAERGFLSGDKLSIVRLDHAEENRLRGFVNVIREKHQKEFNELKSEYISAKLKDTPEHMRKAMAFGL